MLRLRLLKNGITIDKKNLFISCFYKYMNKRHHTVWVSTRRTWWPWKIHGWGVVRNKSILHLIRNKMSVSLVLCCIGYQVRCILSSIWQGSIWQGHICGRHAHWNDRWDRVMRKRGIYESLLGRLRYWRRLERLTGSLCYFHLCGSFMFFMAAVLFTDLLANDAVSPASLLVLLHLCFVFFLPRIIYLL